MSYCKIVTRSSAFLVVIFFFHLLVGSSASAGQVNGSGIRCRWTCPNDRSALSFVFTQNPLLLVLPGESLEVSAVAPAARLLLYRDDAPFREDAVLHFTAPERAGSYYIPITLTESGRSWDMELCVVVPFKATARRNANGFELSADNQQIGHYRHPSKSGNAKVRDNPDSYEPPAWWFRVTSENAAFAVVPGLIADELVVPTEDTGMKHTDMVPVHYPMWNAINTLRHSLPSIGVPAEALTLISMFRSPPYNRAVGSNAFGRHIYGDAFDFYIDIDNSGKAADLNRDKKLDRRDAYPVVALIEDLQADGKLPMGGIGVYNSVAGDHVVTMHLDLRGHRATWGYRYSASGRRSEFLWQSIRHSEIDRQWEIDSAERARKENRTYTAPKREPLR